MIQTEPIRTPCIRVCAVDPKTNWCEGCFRTLKEIVGWTRMGADERERVMAELPQRQAIVAARAAGQEPETSAGSGP